MPKREFPWQWRSSRSRLTRRRKLAEKAGFPAVLKIVSPEITHKSDIGGVKVGLASAAEVRQAFDEIVAAAKKAEPKARIDGVAVQKMAPAGHGGHRRA